MADGKLRARTTASAEGVFQPGALRHFLHPTRIAKRTATLHTRPHGREFSFRERLPGSGDIKTDDKDLEGIFRAAVNGFGLLKPAWDETYQELQLLARHRRDLVEKRAKMQCQIRQCLERCLPGYAALFPEDDLWTRPIAMARARRAGSARAILEAGVKGVRQWVEEEKLPCQARTLDRVVEHDAHAKAITGRAGLFPSRYQSDEVDRADGPLARYGITGLESDTEAQGAHANESGTST